MQNANPKLSMAKLAAAEARAVLGAGSRDAGLDRDMARLCWLLTLQGARFTMLGAYGTLLRRAGRSLQAWAGLGRRPIFISSTPN